MKTMSGISTKKIKYHDALTFRKRMKFKKIVGLTINFLTRLTNNPQEVLSEDID